MADDGERSQEQLVHDLAVANNCGERAPGRHRRESVDDLDTEGRDPEQDGAAKPPAEPPSI